MYIIRVALNIYIFLQAGAITQQYTLACTHAHIHIHTHTYTHKHTNTFLCYLLTMVVRKKQVRIARSSAFI